MASWAETVLRARWLVASLGEASSPPWWRSEATGVVGRRMLERLFPRTVVAASLETAGRAARIEHDARIGRTGAYHLFRLPVVDEALIREQLRVPATANGLSELAALEAVEGRLEALGGLAGSESAPGTQGPVLCGVVGASRRERTVRQMCAAYAAGFRAGTPVYPYLEGVAS